MKTEIIYIHTPGIHLNQLLKLAGICENGAEANDFILSGQVMVNGIIEKRKRKQLAVGDVIECGDTVYQIELEQG